jgi:Response regulator containing CheY-like receiver domain and AraC-type DNA-binding domain
MNIKNFRKSQRMFMNILLAITCSIVMTALILSTVLHYNYENILVNFINNSNLKLLSQTSNSLSYINEAAINSGISLLMNNDAKYMLYNNSSDEFLLSNCFERIIKTVNTIPYIHSVYLYNDTRNIYYSTSMTPINSQDEFIDRELVNYINNTTESNIKLLPRKIPASYPPDSVFKNVYTYIFYDRAITGSAKKDAIILNLKTDWLTNEFQLLNTSDDSNNYIKNNLFIINTNGVIVYHPDEKMFLKNVANEPYIKRILINRNSSHGFFIDNVENQKSIISYVSSTNVPDWLFINIIPFKVISSQVSTVRKITILICLVILFLGIIISFILSIKVYTPIDTLVTSIKNQTSQSEAFRKNLDEINFISNAFIAEIEKNKSLENFKKNNYNLLKQEMLKNILLSNSQNIDDITAQFKEFDLPLNPHIDICLVVLRIDRYYQFQNKFNNEDADLMRFAIQSITNEIISSLFMCETVDMGQDIIIVIISIPDISRTDNNQLKETLIDCLSRIQSESEKHLCISLSATLSHFTPDMKELNLLYKETLELSNYRLIYGHNCIISQENMKSIIPKKYMFPVEKLDYLLKELKLGNMLEVTKKFKEITSDISKFTYPNIILSYTVLSSSIFNTLNIIESNGIIDFEKDYYIFNKEMSNAETMNEINVHFIELFNHVDQKMNTVKNKKTDRIVQNIKDIINKNYTDINLSLVTIADTLRMSSDYIGKVFREYTSCSVSDFISNIRLEKSRELIINSDSSINEIAQKVGFCNTKYFFTIFKKRFGVTPGDFRLKNNIKIDPSD